MGSVRMLPAAVWMRNVAWPTKVTTAVESASAGGCCGSSSMRFGQGVLGSRSIRGPAVTGCPAVPVGLTKRWPSKWSLIPGVIARESRPFERADRPALLGARAHHLHVVQGLKIAVVDFGGDLIAGLHR